MCQEFKHFLAEDDGEILLLLPSLITTPSLFGVGVESRSSV